MVLWNQKLPELVGLTLRTRFSTSGAWWDRSFKHDQKTSQESSYCVSVQLKPQRCPSKDRCSRKCLSIWALTSVLCVMRFTYNAWTVADKPAKNLKNKSVKVRPTGFAAAQTRGIGSSGDPPVGEATGERAEKSGGQVTLVPGRAATGRTVAPAT
eukprot:3990591-Amphidinium_carterae.1